ncbi:unnamed protein product, partial [Closterium sp. NIES-54]
MAASVIHVANARELVREVEALFPKLDPQMDWDARMAALKRLEGLFRGAARIGVTGISALLRQLVMPHLAVQLQDGRSKIIKQACNLVSAIAECLSGEFEACADIVLQ